MFKWQKEGLMYRIISFIVITSIVTVMVYLHNENGHHSSVHHEGHENHIE